VFFQIRPTVTNTPRRIQREAAPAQADKSCGFSVESAIIPAHSGENQQKDKEEQAYLLNHWKNCVPPGVDDAAYVKAVLFTYFAKGKAKSSKADTGWWVKRPQEGIGTNKDSGPGMATVSPQDNTGPTTRAGVKDSACFAKFSMGVAELYEDIGPVAVQKEREKRKRPVSHIVRYGPQGELMEWIIWFCQVLCILQ